MVKIYTKRFINSFTYVFEVIRYGQGGNPSKFTLKTEDVERLIRTVKNELRNDEIFLRVSEIQKKIKSTANKLNREIIEKIKKLSKNL